jgi:hypothetical protein
VGRVIDLGAKFKTIGDKMARPEPVEGAGAGGFKSNAWYPTSGVSKGEARSSSHPISAAPNPLILFVPISVQKSRVLHSPDVASCDVLG